MTRSDPAAEPSAGRLFFAVPLDDDVRAALERHLQDLPPGLGLPGRAVVAANWHLTLRFLGDTTRDECARLTAAMASAALGPPFEIAFDAFGAFPSPRHASVVWIGVGGGKELLEAVAARVEEATRLAGLPPADKPFKAHLTLSRLPIRSDVSAFLEGAPAFAATQRVDHVSLIRSFLRGGPPRYEELARFPLTE